MGLFEEYERTIDATRWLLARDILQRGLDQLTPQQRLRLMLETASNPATSTEVLDWLAAVGNAGVLERVAEHANVSPECLAMLAEHESADVRAAVGANPACDELILRALLADPDPNVRYSLAESYALPSDLLEILVADADPYVSCRAFTTMRREMEEQMGFGSGEAHEVPVSVFLTEDDDFVRAVLRASLQAVPELDLVGEASDGRSAIEQILSRRPDVVLMDIGLPEMDGIQATKIIKALSPDTRVLMVTAHDSDDDIVGAFEAGADGYFLKSSSSLTLTSAIQHVFMGIPWFDPGVTSAVLKRCCREIVAEEAALDPAPEDPRIARLWDGLIAEVDRSVSKNHIYEAIIQCQMLVAVADNYYLEPNKLTTRLLSKLADLHYMVEDYKQSEEKYQQVMRMREGIGDKIDRTLDEHVFVLARMYESRFDYEQAELYYAWSCRISERLQDGHRLEEGRRALQRVLQARGGSSMGH